MIQDDLFDWTPPPRKPHRPVLPPGDGDNFDISDIPDEVVVLFEDLSLMTIKRGRKHYSARDISSRMRWYYDFERAEGDYKFNDHWTPDLARWFMAIHPEYNGFFELRQRKVIANGEDE